MNYSQQMMGRRSSLIIVAAAIAATAAALAMAPLCNTDAVAYLVNVTVRPGHNFANADQALAYGRGVCDNIAGGVGCPELIWQLRRSAAGYIG